MRRQARRRPATVGKSAERSRGSGPQDLLGLYLREIGRHPLLTAEEEVELGRLIEQGAKAQARLDQEDLDAKEKTDLEAQVQAGRDARCRFIESNVRLVVSIARHYAAPGLPLLDLIHEGTLGLIRAVEKFDHRRSFKFSTYATWWIRQAIGRAVADKGRLIRIPVHQLERVNKVRKAQAELRNEGREPPIEKIAELAGVAPEKARDALCAPPEPLSLNQPVGEDGLELGELIDDQIMQPEAAAGELAGDEVRAVLQDLPEAERDVLALRFGLWGESPASLTDIGNRFNISRKQVRQIELSALSKLRSPSVAGRLSRGRAPRY